MFTAVVAAAATAASIGRYAPLGWDVHDQNSVARTTLAIMSDWFPMTTGEIVHVDGGYHAIGA